MFPAIYRYILNTAYDGTIFFADNANSRCLVEDQNDWTFELFNALKVND